MWSEHYADGARPDSTDRPGPCGPARDDRPVTTDPRSTVPDPCAADLREPALLAALADLGLGRIDVLDEVGSTNEHLTAAVTRQARGPRPDRPWTDLSLVLTGHQSAGRGRLDRVWTTEPGTALTFSLLLRPADARGRPLPTQHFPWLTLLMAAAVVDALDGLAAAGARIKWPNDVLVDGRKAAGLLAGLVLDAQHPPAVVLGTGINVAQQELPVDTATSVRRATGREVERAAVLRAVLGAFVPVYRQFCADPEAAVRPDGPLRARITERMETIGRPVRAELPGGAAPVTGTATGLGEHGGLLVREDGGAEREVTAGDVVHLRPAPDAPGTA
jgi:BirA family biotin operon repressor/biotin-[acetyl-CoA-carboxylase] ligase